MSHTPPKLFVSYSWTNPDHENWVIQLATDLRDSGVDVILDKWDLREGHDSISFMEKMVNDKEVTKVILICDKAYSDKANGRTGGVGVEAQIISPEVYAKADQEKFVAIVKERDDSGAAYLPTYYKSRIYIDLSDSSRNVQNFEQLLRWAFGKPLHVKPQLGAMPRYLTGENSVTLGTGTLARRAVDAVRNAQPHSRGAISEYLETFVKNLERFRMPQVAGERDDQFIENIECFTTHRNEMIEVFFTLAQYQYDEQSMLLVHRFFEGLLPYLDRQENMNAWNEMDFDNFRFLIHELFLYAIAIFLKYERFEFVGELLSKQFYFSLTDRCVPNGMVSFRNLWQPVRLLEIRNRRMKLSRLSLQADILRDRSSETGIEFRQVMQADFVLFIRSAFERLHENNCWIEWYPLTLVYAGRQSSATELFVRAKSKAYFARVCKLLGIGGKPELDNLIDAFSKGKLPVPRWVGGGVFVSPSHMMAYEAIASIP